jgi:hypothetical protein
MVIVTIEGKEIDVENIELPDEVLRMIAEAIDSK